MRCPSRDAERFAPRGSKRNVDVRSVGDVRDEAVVVAMIGKSECRGFFFKSSRGRFQRQGEVAQEPWRRRKKVVLFGVLLGRFVIM